MEGVRNVQAEVKSPLDTVEASWYKRPPVRQAQCTGLWSEGPVCYMAVGHGGNVLGAWTLWEARRGPTEVEQSSGVLPPPNLFRGPSSRWELNPHRKRN